MRAKLVTVSMCSVAVVGLLAIAGVRMAAQGSATSYTEEQSTRGAALSQMYCSACHGENLKGGDLAPTLQGDDFMKWWKDQTVGDLYERIDTSMPANAPGTLKAPEIADVVAFILKLNNTPAGAQELPADKTALKAMKFGQ